MTDRDLDAVRNAFESNPTFDGSDRDLVVAIYNALADGHTVAIASLAQQLERSAADVRTTLDLCNLEFDGDQIVAFGGLSRRETAHAFHIRGRRLYTWCAWDPLFIAPILNEDALVESSCPVTGQQILLVVGPSGVREVTPPSAVLSMLVPGEACRTDIVSNFCNEVLLFSSEEAAARWTAERSGTFVISVNEAFDLGRAVVRQLRAGDGSEP